MKVDHTKDDRSVLKESWLRQIDEKGSLMNHFQLSAQEKETILDQRAARLARRQQTVVKFEGLEIIEFALGSAKYGIESRWVKEVLPLKGLTPIPCTPEFILGVTQLRGRLVSVLDLKKFLKSHDEEITDLNQLFILHNETMEFGVLADTIEEVTKIPYSELSFSPDLTSRSDFVMGVTKDRTIVLNGERLLNDPCMLIREHIS